MLRNSFFQLARFARRTPFIYRFSQSNKKNSDQKSQLVLKNQDFDKIVEYWDQQVSKPKPNSLSIEKVINKISLAEHLLGSELQDKNWDFFEDMFDKNFLERLYIPSQYPQKIQLILNLSMELSVLEYQYRLNRKEFQQLESVLERIRGVLENIYNFEAKISDLGEAEFNNLLRQSQYFDMKAFYQKTSNPEGYVEFLEESTKCLDQAVKIVNDIIKHKESVEQIKYQVGKTQAMSKIARNFEMLAEFLLISGQDAEARPFLEKALEIYNTFTEGITPKHVLCRCRIARSYIKEDYELAQKQIQELYENLQQFGETDFLFIIQMYKFVIQSSKQVVETEYEQVFEMMNKFRITDPLIMSEVLYHSIKYTYDQGYSKALNEHLHQALVLIQTSVGKINLEQLLYLIAKVAVDLPRDIHDQVKILKIIYEDFEKLKQFVDDSYFLDHLFFQSLIKSKLLIFDKMTPEIVIQPLLQFIEQAKQSEQNSLINYIKLITKFLEKNGVTITQKQLEDISSKQQIK